MTSKASQTPTRSASQPAARKLRALPPQLREPTYERGGLRNALVEEGRRMFEENVRAS